MESGDEGQSVEQAVGESVPEETNPEYHGTGASVVGDELTGDDAVEPVDFLHEYGCIVGAARAVPDSLYRDVLDADSGPGRREGGYQPVSCGSGKGAHQVVHGFRFTEGPISAASELPAGEEFFITGSVHFGATDVTD